MITTAYIDHQYQVVRQREYIHYEVNEAEEPDWYDLPTSVYAAYEDAVQAERY